jgi:hypothetical protein
MNQAAEIFLRAWRGGFRVSGTKRPRFENVDALDR